MFLLVWVTKVIQDAYKNAYYHSSSLNPFNHSALCFLIRLPTTMPISVNCNVRFPNICTCLPVRVVGRKKWLMVTSFSHTKLCFCVNIFQVYKFTNWFKKTHTTFCKLVSIEDFFFLREGRLSYCKLEQYILYLNLIKFYN